MEKSFLPLLIIFSLFAVALSDENFWISGNVVDKSQMPPVTILDSSMLPAPVDSVITLSRPCVAAELSMSASDGFIVVHPVKNADGIWYKMPLVAGYRNCVLFDKISVKKYTGRSSLTDIVVFPVYF